MSFKEKFLAILFLFRPERTSMVTTITATGAVLAGAVWQDILLITLAGWFLAVSGFSLDFFADRELDKLEPRSETRRNPFAREMLPKQVGPVFSITFMIASLITTIFVSMWGLIAWGFIFIIIVGLAFQWFNFPIARGITLGGLQFLYFFLGATTGTISPAVIILAFMFFFAMFGGKGVTDIRDFPVDQETPVSTFPKKYGIRRTVHISVVSLFISYILSLGVYWTGELSAIYLYLDIVFLVTGFIITGLFFFKASPRFCLHISMVYMMGQGILICITIILGKLIII
jgi:4-hydroxybenzoate polyprenyltransferase